MEPFTIAAIAGIAGAGLKTVIGGCVEGLADRALSGVTRELVNRIGGLRGLPANHDAARSLRRAQLQALQLVVRQFDRSTLPEWAEDPINKPEIFISEAKAFVTRNLSLCVSITVTEELAVKLSDSMDGAFADGTEEPAGDRLGVSRAAAENAVLEELQEELGATVVPDSFRARFKGNVEDEPGWFEAFGLFLAEELKANERFRSIFTATKLSSLEGLALDGLDIVTRIDQRSDQMAGDLEFVRGAVDAIADSQIRQTDLLEQIAVKLGLTAGTDQLDIRVGELGIEHGASRAEILGLLKDIVGEGVPADQINQAIAQARLNLSATREELERLRSLASEAPEIEPDLAAARAALDNADIMQLEAAQTAIRHARERYFDVISQRRTHESDNLASLYESEASIALSRSRSLDAAQLFGEAAEVAPRSEIEKRRHLRLQQAAALQTHGTLFANLDALREAAAILEWNVLPDTSHRSAERYEAEVQRAEILQTIFVRTGGNESGAARDRALAIHDILNLICDRDGDPISWARLQNMRGILFRTISERMTDDRSYWQDKAIYAYQKAMEVYVEHDMTDDLALVRMNAANIQRVRSEEAPPAEARVLLETAAASFVAMSEQFTRETYPVNWAIGKNNLADAYAALGNLSEGEEQDRFFNRAEMAAKEALEVRTREAMPKDWATTRTNLAALKYLRAGRETKANRAVAAYEGVVDDREEILEVQTKTGMPRQWADQKYYIGRAYAMIGKWSHGQPQLDAYFSAVVAYTDALQVFTQNDSPLDWAHANLDLGDASNAMSQLAADDVLAESYHRDAVEAYGKALELFTDNYYPAVQVRALRDLGDVQFRIGSRYADGNHRNTWLERSITSFNGALAIHSRNEGLARWAQLHIDLAVSYETLANVTIGKAAEKHAIAAISAFENGISSYDRGSETDSWVIAARGAARVRKVLADRKTGPEQILLLEMVIRQYDDVIETCVGETLSTHRVQSQFQVAMALVQLDQAQGDETVTENLERAEQQLEAVFEFALDRKIRTDRALAQRWIGEIAIRRGRRVGKDDLVRSGLKSLDAAIQLYEEDNCQELADEVKQIRQEVLSHQNLDGKQ